MRRRETERGGTEGSPSVSSQSCRTATSPRLLFFPTPEGGEARGGHLPTRSGKSPPPREPWDPKIGFKYIVRQSEKKNQEYPIPPRKSGGLPKRKKKVSLIRTYALCSELTPPLSAKYNGGIWIDFCFFDDMPYASFLDQMALTGSH